ncbi:oligosaccharide repeat unit polymerase [Erysipelotrichaceae bacterium Oil+RF-744-GAM-WT-6]|uniref:Oligosaccharide repeat unit polymerase n=1 Tax=Stecheria intestinalis TaxID=2606630 RepID=A0A7X2NU49_9FIRM|nr:oligosaccharide repeat unit polymerase [Stecheria intestinalis]MSS59520.1 oligosaccharide repeat unit polymerase [Stecheria intestinalis]
MYIVYLLLSLIEYAFALNAFKKKINPVSIYLIIWNIMIGLYETHWVRYNEITMFCWFTVIVFQFIFFISCIFGSKCIFTRNGRSNDVTLDDKTLLKGILILTVIASFAIIPNFVNFIHKYSFNFMDEMNQVYQDRLTGNRGFEMIPYLGTLVSVAVLLSGIYFRKFGFNKWLLFPLLMSLLDTLPGGGRSGVIIELLLFLMPVLLFGKVKSNESSKMKKRNIILILIAVVVLVVVFWQMSSVRSRWMTTDQYMSPTMVKLFRISPAIYKTFLYITEPFVTLSEYLKDQTFQFGINTFGMFYNILNKIGFNLPYERYQTAYYVPMECNVATYIREIIQDFTYFVALFVTAFLGLLSGTTFISTRYKLDDISEARCSILGTIITLSFFMFFLRETVFWVLVIITPIYLKILSQHKYAIQIGSNAE